MQVSSTAIVLAAALCAGAAQADTLTFQNGIGGYAGNLVIAIGSGGPNTSFTGETLSVDGSTSDYGAPGVGQVLIRFDDLFSAGGIPVGATILGATLRTVTDSETDTNISIHRMLVDWNSSSTWNSLVDGVGLGVDTVAAADDTKGPIEDPSAPLWDVTASVQAWAAGAANHGWVFTNDGGNGWDVFTNLAAQGSRPELTVEYAAPVPLPAAVWLLGSAVAAVGMRRRPT